MDGDYVLVVGSAVLEISGKTVDVLQPGMRQHGHIHASVSGVARNIAENLARLDIETVLLSAIADDDMGQHLITHSTLAGIDCRHVLRVSGSHTATIHIAIPDGRQTLPELMTLSIADSLDSDYLMEHEWLFRESRARCH